MWGQGRGKKKDVAGRGVVVDMAKAAAGAAILPVGSVRPALRVGALTTPPPIPWGYRKLDPAKTARIAYENWYKKYCCYAVASAILDQLRDEIGGPYNNLPVEAFAFGQGGMAGWGAMCGTLTGAGLAMSFVAGKEGEEMVNDLIVWYGNAELPVFRPATPKAIIRQVNAAGSPLCHISVGKWMKKEEVGLESAERKERCARVAADVAFQAVILLNKWADGDYEMRQDSRSQAHGIAGRRGCMQCDGSGVS